MQRTCHCFRQAPLPELLGKQPLHERGYGAGGGEAVAVEEVLHQQHCTAHSSHAIICLLRKSLCAIMLVTFACNGILYSFSLYRKDEAPPRTRTGILMYTTIYSQPRGSLTSRSRRRGNLNAKVQARQQARTGEEHDEGTLDGIAPELGGAAEEAGQAASEHAEDDRQGAVRNVPGGVAVALHRQVDEQRVARDRDRVVEACRRHHRRRDRCAGSNTRCLSRGLDSGHNTLKGSAPVSTSGPGIAAFEQLAAR